MRENVFYLTCMLIWSFSVLFRGLDLFILSDETRTYYVIVKESINDSKSFMRFVGYICIVFGLVTSLLKIGDQDKSNLLELTLTVF